MRFFKKVCLLLLLIAPVQVFANTPASVAGPLSEVTATLLRNGEELSLSLTMIGDQEFLNIDQMAKLAGAQLRWQSVSQQACLSNLNGMLCFNWDRSQVEKDGHPTRNKFPLRFEDNRLYVPMKYVLSKEFQNYCESDLEWDQKLKRLSQVSPINLSLPLVEKLGDKYQLRMETPDHLPYSLIEKSPKRIWVRFMRARSEGSQVLEGDSVIREVKIIQRRRSTDLMVSLGEDAVTSEIYFDEGKKNLFIDVSTVRQIAEADGSIDSSVNKAQVRKTPIPVRSVNSVPSPATNPSIKKQGYVGKSDRNVRTIVIDAGHGGVDAGAIGARGTLEKNINLEVARALAKLLKKEKNVRVVMTRDNDEFIPLNARTDIANEVSADIFVSIHCNSSLSSKNNGFEAYFLSPDATDKAAESVARLENSVVSLETKKGSPSSRLGQLLASMAVYEQINESSRFASILCRHIREKTSLDKAVVKEADFYVLRGAQMPAVLVELEYLSNPVSEIKLRSSRFRSNLVKGIADGILMFDKQLRLEKEAVASQVKKTVNKTER